MAIKPLWAEKYRPPTLKGYIFQDETQKTLIQQFIKDKSIPNLLFIGRAGTGKTTLALALKNLLEIDDMDFLKLNSSTNNSVEVVRNKLNNFVSSYPLGEFKLVFLDEADRLTPNAQDALRAMTEECSGTVRFILACNNPNKIIVPLRSRLQEFEFKVLPKDALLKTAATVLHKENITVPDIELVERYVEMAYPDCRRLLNLLEKHSSSGTLIPPEDVSKLTEVTVKILELMEEDKWHDIREYAAAAVSDDDWEEVYRFIYDYLHEVGKFTDRAKWAKAIIYIAEHLWRHSTVADPEINFAALTIKLSDL